jgi:hypothetical protein
VLASAGGRRALHDDDCDAGTYYAEAGSLSSRFELTPRSEREKD